MAERPNGTHGSDWDPPTVRKRSPRPPSRSSLWVRLGQPLLIGLVLGVLVMYAWHIGDTSNATQPGVPAGSTQVPIGTLLSDVNAAASANDTVKLTVYPDRVVATGPTFSIWSLKNTQTSIWDLVPRADVLSGKISIDERNDLPETAGGQLFHVLGAIMTILLMVALGGFLVFFTWYLAKSVPRSSMNKNNRHARPSTFADVAGLDAVRDDVEEVVSFLKEPERFTRLGARCPRGVLLIGPPGTGKTLIARAVAGEASAAFYAVSGSDFVEMFVGMGSRRVRELFAEARKHQPAIVFIDEIDAVGRKRTGQSGGGQSEYEQTINQLLTEMDGFAGTESIVIMAATNRLDVLDPAILRPGRFDRHVHVDLPDRAAREQILVVHARGKSFDDEVSLADVARETTGMSGADLENVLNEAALTAVRQQHERIERSDVAQAVERVLIGFGSSFQMNDDERRRVAIHELGHALLAREFPALGRVEKVSVVSLGAAGGFTRISSDEDRRLLTQSMLEARLAFTLGGMAAESVYCADVSSGAHGDLQQATSIATAMVAEFGMSEVVGPVRLEEGAERQLSEDVRSEIRELTQAALARARVVLQSYHRVFESLVQTLLQEEVWTSERFEELVSPLMGQRTSLPKGNVHKVSTLQARRRTGIQREHPSNDGVRTRPSTALLVRSHQADGLAQPMPARTQSPGHESH